MSGRPSPFTSTARELHWPRLRDYRGRERAPALVSQHDHAARARLLDDQDVWIAPLRTDEGFSEPVNEGEVEKNGT